MVLLSELLKQVESFIEENAELGYTSKEEFIEDTIRSKLTDACIFLFCQQESSSFSM